MPTIIMQVTKRWSLIALPVISGKRWGRVEYPDLSVIIYLVVSNGK